MSAMHTDFASFVPETNESLISEPTGYLMKDRRRGARRVTKKDPHASENTHVSCYRPRFLKREAIARAERLDARLARLSCIEDEVYERPGIEQKSVALDRAVRQPHGSIAGYAGVKRTVFVGQRSARIRRTVHGGPSGFRTYASPLGKPIHYVPRRGVKSIGAEQRFDMRMRGKYNLLTDH